MDLPSRIDLVPSAHRPERLLLLDILGDRIGAVRFGPDIDSEAFFAVTPESLYPFIYVRLRSRGEELHVPTSVLDDLARHYRLKVMRQLRRTSEIRRVGGTLSAAGIPFLLLKGPVRAGTSTRNRRRERCPISISWCMSPILHGRSTRSSRQATDSFAVRGL